MGILDTANQIVSKDVNTVKNNSNSFMDSAGGGFESFTNSLTGEEVPANSKVGEAISKSKDQGETSNPVNSNNIGANILNPEIADLDPVYSALGKPESYKIPKAEQGAATTAQDILDGEQVIQDNRKPWSLFNQWSLMNYSGTPISDFGNSDYNKPMFTGPNLQAYRNPTASFLIEQTADKIAYRYSFADFALAKHYGKIPNNYMLTLRRFPMPVEDNIINPTVIGPDGTAIEEATSDLARAITWMSEEAGNKLEDIIKFNVSTTWEEVKSSIQEMTSGGNRGGKLGSTIGGSSALSAIYGAANGMDANAVHNAKNGYDPVKGTYPNHVFGPINVINKVMVRQQGLEFDQSFDLKFQYNLRQIKGVSPKVAFLDLLSNLLVLTYNNGNFWGGSVRYTGGSSALNKPFGDFSKLKSGDLGGFLGSVAGDLMGKAGNLVNDIKENGLMGNKITQNLLGGSLMNMFGTPQGGEAINAFLTGDPTGQYHLTVGNPLNPIAVIGNLYCEKADFQFGGEMSFEGFPTELTLTISLKPARPRDKADIERMFNAGKQRMYLTPEGGVNTNQNSNNSAYGNKDTSSNAGAIYKKMTNG